MSENADDAAAASARAAEQARLRKERREAKIKAGGASRLNKITGLGGGLQRDPPPPAPQQSSAPSSQQPTSPPAAADSHHADDPEEVDISQHYYTPQTTNRIPSPNPMPPMGDISEDALRQMMLGFDPAGGGPGAAGAAGGFPGMGGGFPGMGGGGFPGMGGMGGGGAPGADGEDPMMKMLQQMMAGGGPGGPGGPGGASPFGPGSPFGGPPQSAVVVTDRYAAIWRLLHTAVALGLGLYIALWTSFAGTKLQRVESSVTGSIGRTRGVAGGDGGSEPGGSGGAVYVDGREGKFDSTHFFWAFATAEAVLLTTRWWLDKGRSQTGGGLVGMAMGFLPQPWKGRVEVALRYGQVFGTVRSDVLVCVFVLGVCAWLRG